MARAMWSQSMVSRGIRPMKCVPVDTRDVFARHPDIKIVNEVNANWDQAQGQQAMQNLLATYPDLAGVWVQDGMAACAWRSIADAKRSDSIAATGEIRKDFIDLWVKQGLNSEHQLILGSYGKRT